MDRKQAAQFLGISLRSLDRIVATGRLTKSKGHRKTRPIVLFSDEELGALKREMEERSSAKLFPLIRPAPKETIAFRLDPHYIQALEALTSGDQSPQEVARRLVIQSLETGYSSKVLQEIRRLREALGAAFYALLTLKLGATPEEARRFVAEAILKD